MAGGIKSKNEMDVKIKDLPFLGSYWSEIFCLLEIKTS